jgi:hypothetical protein
MPPHKDGTKLSRILCIKSFSNAKATKKKKFKRIDNKQIKKETSIKEPLKRQQASIARPKAYIKKEKTKQQKKLLHS